MVASEFQAIIMAGGKGSRMPEITVARPKCLLPIANYPMVWYPLQMLVRAGIYDIILIVSESSKAEVQLALERCGFKAHFEIIGIPPGEDWGTADSLRFVADKIKTDVLIVSCDLVTDFSVIEVLNMYRKNQASVTAVFFENSESLGSTPGPKTKNKPEKDLVGIDSATSRLVFLASASDFEETVAFPKSLLRKHQHVTVHSQLLDAHLYVIRHWVVQYLLQEKTFTTIKGELLPYIVKKQLQRPLKPPDGDPSASVVAIDVKREMSQFASVDVLEHEVSLMSSFNDHTGDMQSAYHGDNVRCYAYIASKECFGMRANTLPVYCHLNRKVAKEGGVWQAVVGGGLPLERRAGGADVRSRQVDDDSIVGEQCVLHEKTAVRTSSLGSACAVEPRSLLHACILMDNVRVGPGCKLTNCVVCDDALIGAGTILTNCIVGSSHSVADGESFSNEVLTEMDRLMEI